jgi:hypothetical protein
MGEQDLGVGGAGSTYLLEPPGNEGGVSITGDPKGREDVEIGVGVPTWQGLVSVHEIAPAALLADALGGDFTRWRRWEGLTTGFERDLVHLDPPVGTPDLEIRRVVVRASVGSDKGERLWLRSEVPHARIALEQQDEDALMLRLKLHHPATLVGGDTATVRAEAPDTPHIPRGRFPCERHTT